MTTSNHNPGLAPKTLPDTIRNLLEEHRVVRAIEAHNGLAALIAENATAVRHGRQATFHALWSSSLTDSLSRGKPDTEYVDFSVRAAGLEDIRAVSRKPVIYDADTGGLTEHFAMHVREMERKGVSATIIEDKTGAKRNSLFGTEVAQRQDDPCAFGEKIAAGKAAQQGEDFMVIARIESLILGQGVEDAMARARVYLEAVAKACGYRDVARVETRAALIRALRRLRDRAGPSLLEVVVCTGARADLGRPSETPRENKERFMVGLREADRVLLSEPS